MSSAIVHYCCMGLVMEFPLKSLPKAPVIKYDSVNWRGEYSFTEPPYSSSVRAPSVGSAVPDALPRTLTVPSSAQVSSTPLPCFLHRPVAGG